MHFLSEGVAINPFKLKKAGFYWTKAILKLHSLWTEYHKKRVVFDGKT